MQIIDSQLHEFGPHLKWEGADEGTRHAVMTEILLAWMDAVGVDAAIVNPGVPPWLAKAQAQFPRRLAGVFHFRNPEGKEVEDEVVAMRGVPGALGHRLSFGMLPVDPSGEKGRAKFRAGAFNAVFAACQKHDRLLFCSAYGSCDLIAEIAKAYPGLRMVVDHLGIAQPPLNPRESPPWKGLDALIALAGYPNVNVKLCGVPVLSDQAYPYADVWPHVHRILKAFGVARVMWASDAGRFQGRIGWNNDFEMAQRPYPGRHNYAEALYFLIDTDELSLSEKEALLGGTVRRLTGWTPGAA